MNTKEKEIIKEFIFDQLINKGKDRLLAREVFEGVKDQVSEKYQVENKFRLKMKDVIGDIPELFSKRGRYGGIFLTKNKNKSASPKKANTVKAAKKAREKENFQTTPDKKPKKVIKPKVGSTLYQATPFTNEECEDRAITYEEVWIDEKYYKVPNISKNKMVTVITKVAGGSEDIDGSIYFDKRYSINDLKMFDSILMYALDAKIVSPAKPAPDKENND